MKKIGLMSGLMGAALAAGMLGMSSAMTAGSASISRSYPSFPKEGKSRSKNNPASVKALKQVMFGQFGLGMHSGGKKMAGAGTGKSVTFSPKKDIGKGPEFTRSVRGISNGYRNQHTQREQQNEAARNRRRSWYTESSLDNGCIN